MSIKRRPREGNIGRKGRMDQKGRGRKGIREIRGEKISWGGKRNEPIRQEMVNQEGWGNDGNQGDQER